jgi:hypothetical protein
LGREGREWSENKKRSSEGKSLSVIQLLFDFEVWFEGRGVGLEVWKEE